MFFKDLGTTNHVIIFSYQNLTVNSLILCFLDPIKPPSGIHCDLQLASLTMEREGATPETCCQLERHLSCWAKAACRQRLAPRIPQNSKGLKREKNLLLTSLPSISLLIFQVNIPCTLFNKLLRQAK